MIKRLIFFIAVLSSVIVNGQDQISSPYSHYGIGLPSFNGAAETKAMGGLSIAPDSIHFSFQNPAGMAKLKLTTYTIGLTQKFSNVKNGSGDQDHIRNTAFDYIAIGIPAGKLNFGFGVTPNTSVGYKLEDRSSTTLSHYESSGGLTEVFLSFGYRIQKGLRVGVSGGYNFGKIENENSFYQSGVQYGSSERNRSDLSGFRVKLGAQYETKLAKKLRLKTSASYSPSLKLKSSNQRHLAIMQLGAGNITQVVRQREIAIENTKFDLPSSLRLGAGVGEFNKWFAGFEYEKVGKADYKNTSFSLNDVKYTSGNVYRLGGYFIPNYADFNYFNRINFRAGLRYQELGFTLNQEKIDEFGISFGVGLPAGPYLSNVNIGVEYGQRGTTSSGLIKEDFVNLSIGISFNDKWFRKRKFN